MFEFESVVILVTSLLALFIIMFQVQINVLKRAAIKHDLELLELAGNLKCDESNFESFVKQKLVACSKCKRSFFSAGFIWQLFFGIAVFLCFTWFTITLFGSWWAVLTAVFAVIGLLMPIDALIADRGINRELGRLSAAISNYEQTLLQRANVGEAYAEPPQKVFAAKPAVRIASYQCLPEDSTLRRHFVSNLRREIEATFAPRPTDSALRRHYDTMIDAVLEHRLPEKYS